MDTYSSSYQTPGWQRAQRQASEGQQDKQQSRTRGSYGESAGRRGALTIDGELVAKSSTASGFATGARVFHIKFGNGTIAGVDGNKLTVDFDKAGRKMVLESFVQAA
jgi:DNA helicase-2/ATP-dependent DNA helicase PcrA